MGVYYADFMVTIVQILASIKFVAACIFYECTVSAISVENREWLPSLAAPRNKSSPCFGKVGEGGNHLEHWCRVYDTDMWQSHVVIKRYSIAYFDRRIAELP